MTGLTPPDNVGAATDADTPELDEQLHTYVCICAEFLPAIPDFDNHGLTALPGSNGLDRISLLPDALLGNIVSRLLVTEAACTAVLSSRWRQVWLSAPLSLVDAYLRPSINPPDITDIVTGILEAHSGPFRCVHLVCSNMNVQLARWLELLAAKGVEELVLVNRPCAPKVPFPNTLFRVTSLTRLYIGQWKFSDVATLPRGTIFPHLREIGICSSLMNGTDVEAVVARSPVLEILSIEGGKKSLRLRLVSGSLRCVQICNTVVENLAVVKAPYLDRLIIENVEDNDAGCTRVSIGDGPKLQALGILEPGYHVLDIRGTIIVAGIKASPSTIVMHIKILSLKVQFGNYNDVKMVPTFLRCFPSLVKLHITSGTFQYQAGSAKFWELAKPTENIRSSIKVLSFREFRGEIGEVAFLKFFFGSARILTSATITMANLSFTSIGTEKVLFAAQQAYKKRVCKSCKIAVLGSDGPEGCSRWSFKTGTDYSFEDPFSSVEWEA